MTCPLVNFAVRLHSVDEVRAAILKCNGITVIMIHLGEDVDHVRVELDIRVIDDAEGVEL